jgi:hypothetical protein
MCLMVFISPKLCFLQYYLIHCLLPKVVFLCFPVNECFHNLVDGNWLMGGGVESHTFLVHTAQQQPLATRSDDFGSLFLHCCQILKFKKKCNFT